jgi:hypothetical protein
MATTTAAPWSLPYPQANDLVRDGENAMQSLAERIATLFTDNFWSAPLNYTAVTPLAAGWTGNVWFALRAGWVHVVVDVTKGASGWLVNEQLATIPAGFRPKLSDYRMLPTTGASPSSRSVQTVLNAAGTIVLLQAGDTTLTGIHGAYAYPLFL